MALCENPANVPQANAAPENHGNTHPSDGGQRQAGRDGHARHRLPHLEGRAALDLIHLAQEAITNVIKHAQARTLLVQVWQESSAGGERVCLLLQDDGVGLRGSRQANPQGGLGLNNMRRRAERIGATLSLLDAQPGLGIRLCFTLHETPEHSSLIGAGAANIDIDFDLIEQTSNR